MDFETFWRALQAKGQRIGFDLSKPGNEVTITADNLKQLLEQAHSQWVDLGKATSKQSALDSIFEGMGF